MQFCSLTVAFSRAVGVGYNRGLGIFWKEGLCAISMGTTCPSFPT